jgi:hypothetical protein
MNCPEGVHLKNGKEWRMEKIYFQKYQMGEDDPKLIITLIFRLHLLTKKFSIELKKFNPY